MLPQETANIVKKGIMFVFLDHKYHNEIIWPWLSILATPKFTR